jgi:hypothetical protein
VAKHPVTKPNLASIERSEEKVAKELAEMMEEAIRTTEVILAQ